MKDSDSEYTRIRGLHGIAAVSKETNKYSNIYSKALSHKVSSMLGQRRRRWPNIELTLWLALGL